MKLVHFSDTRLKKLRKVDQQDELFYKLFDAPRGKPRGLWVSDESATESWSWFCKENDIRPIDYQYKYNVTLLADANILYIRDAEQLLEFTKKYHKPPRRPGSPFIDSINWHQVAKEYQGIIITPYIWECRMGAATHWYYTWDVASGCIWDTSCLSIRLCPPRRNQRRGQDKTLIIIDDNVEEALV